MSDHDLQMLEEETTLDDVQEWLEEIAMAIEEAWYAPTDLEVEFLDSVRGQLAKHLEDNDDETDEQPLAGKQLASLRGIYDKVV